jgi:DNA-directed RNA polymerase specialized sigma24 family protein|tara:strand:- start:261 stop:902 length:642 start_codon:yes stop_codon:yes gene_type:complete
MAKRRDPNSAHYIDNKEFLVKISAYRELRIEAEESGEPKPRVTNYLGECFVKIANHLAYKSNFVNYTFRDEMILDGIENCLTYMDNFNPEKSKNPFAYFTQITYYAFIRRIQKEKRQMETKFKYIKSLDIDQILESGDGETHTNEYLSYMRNIIEQAEADNAKADKANEGKKMPKRRPKYLDEKIKAEEAAALERAKEESNEENGQPKDEFMS